MKLVLELKNEPKKDDVLIFDGERFVCVKKDIFLKSLDAKICDLNNKISQLNKIIAEIDNRLMIQEGGNL